MADALTPSEFSERFDLVGWSILGARIEAVIHAGSFAAAAGLVGDICALADEQDHHPDLDLRYPDIVHVAMWSHDAGGLTARDARLAQSISALAEASGFSIEPGRSQAIELAIDTVDVAAIVPFWQAVLGYEPVASDDSTTASFVNLFDPRGTGPNLWFQPSDAPRPERNTIHLDIIVDPAEAEARLAAALAAGGVLVDDSFAPAWWVLADAEGNEACICTWLGRD